MKLKLTERNKKPKVSRYRRDKILFCMQRTICANASCEYKRVVKCQHATTQRFSLTFLPLLSQHFYADRAKEMLFSLCRKKQKGEIERLQLPCDILVILFNNSKITEKASIQKKKSKHKKESRPVPDEHTDFISNGNIFK